MCTRTDLNASNCFVFFHLSTVQWQMDFTVTNLLKTDRNLSNMTKGVFWFYKLPRTEYKYLKKKRALLLPDLTGHMQCVSSFLIPHNFIFWRWKKHLIFCCIDETWYYISLIPFYVKSTPLFSRLCECETCQLDFKIISFCRANVSWSQQKVVRSKVYYNTSHCKNEVTIYYNSS